MRLALSGIDEPWLSGPSLSVACVLPILAGIFLPIFLPYMQLGFFYTFWPVLSTEKPEIDRKHCKCPCWDTKFKGSYEAWPAGYKHMYFNITWNTLCMWIITVIAVIATYETTVHLVRLCLRRHLRLSMFALVLASIYPHYYTWWAMINMWNDDFYDQWVHQSYFSITEAISTIVIIYLCNNQHPLRTRPLLVIALIAVFHIGASSWDQFIHNIFYGRGQWHQQSRDLAFMTFDLLNLLISGGHLTLLYLKDSAISGRTNMRRDLIGAGAAAMILIFINTVI